MIIYSGGQKATKRSYHSISGFNFEGPSLAKPVQPPVIKSELQTNIECFSRSLQQRSTPTNTTTTPWIIHAAHIDASVGQMPLLNRFSLKVLLLTFRTICFELEGFNYSMHFFRKASNNWNTVLTKSYLSIFLPGVGGTTQRNVAFKDFLLILVCFNLLLLI